MIQTMSKEVAEFMVFIVERVALRFFQGDQPTAYAVMKDTGLWDFFVNTYDTSHTLGVEYLMEEAQDCFAKRGVNHAVVSR
jgi:hypothetical protein